MSFSIRIHFLQKLINIFKTEALNLRELSTGQIAFYLELTNSSTKLATNKQTEWP